MVKIAYTEKDFETFQKNELKETDTFRFGCKMCGNCCRKRQEPILITGADIFRIAKALGETIEDTIIENTRGYIGDTSHCPVVVLKERLDGSCRLLRKGRCMVQENKPVPCALFPLGRYFDMRDKKYHYFINEKSCTAGCQSDEEWTLREWLDKFRIEETEEMTAAWHTLFTGICAVTHKMGKKEIQGHILDAMLGALYFNYDLNRPYNEQVEDNKNAVRAVFKRELNKILEF